MHSIDYPNNSKETEETLQVAKLTNRATIPTQGSDKAAGFDLYSAYDYIIPPKGKIMVKTDIQLKVPVGTYGRIASRSSVAFENHIDISAGVIDEDYRGNVGIVMFNHANTEFNINTGDRIAQLICEKISYPNIKELITLDETKRGEKGFGSTN